MFLEHPINCKSARPAGAEAVIWCDGSCPANPGPMGIGYVLHVNPEWAAGGTEIKSYRYGSRLGPGTNNQAEYYSLIAALREALRQCVTHITVHMDSLLVVNHVLGKWKCKDYKLRMLLQEAAGLAVMFTSFKLDHVLREFNTEADALSKHPIEPSLPPNPTEINFIGNRVRRRKLSRCQAALIKYWYEKNICRNEYRVARIFGIANSFAGKIGQGEKYPDISEADLPGPHFHGALIEWKRDLTEVEPRRCSSFGADPDLKPGPLGPEDRGWTPE
jgi:ribonuclease HI